MPDAIYKPSNPQPTRFDRPPGGGTITAIGQASTEPVTVGNLVVDGTTTQTGAVAMNGGATVTGGLTADTITGTVNAKSSFAAIAVDGAITITAANKTYFITKASAAAITIVDPTATTHDGVTLTIISTTAFAHTVSNAAGSGFNAGGAASDVGTYGGAKGDNFRIIAYQGKWYVERLTNVTLG